MKLFYKTLVLAVVCWGVLFSGSTAVTFAAHPQAHSTKNEGKNAETKAIETHGKIDLNTASKKELDELPGIGPALANKIVAGRPYSSVGNLSRAGIPASTIHKITPLVTVESGTIGKNTEQGRGTERSQGHKSDSVATPSLPSSEAITKDSASKGNSTSAGHNPNPKETSSTSGQSNVSPDQAQAQGMVWVNLDSGVYHRGNSRYYGKTKEGKYMPEADAVKAGYRAAKNEK